jgi:ankyrin repeat protein
LVSELPVTSSKGHAARVAGRWAIAVVIALGAACTDRQAAASLEQAVRAGDPAAVQQLLSAGVSANASLSEGWTPLTLAASLGHLDIVTHLAGAGADLEQARRVGVERQWTPLGWAAFGGHRDVVEWLIARGARLEARTSRHQTPLMAAALGGHLEVLELLVDAGADQSAMDAAGRTAREMLP